ncbi:MAG: CDP-diacylglycerol--glycerol-3-phosphate 3-phosphatidyltransferase [Treponemataceae bacterium]
MKLSNVLSASRIVLAPLFLIVFFMPTWFYNVENIDKIVILILIPLFIFIQITDYLDGKVARTMHTITDFGKHFDPFCDALANLTIIFCFMSEGFFQKILFIVILYREFGITFLRMLASQHSFSIPAKMGGKVKTVMYIFASGFSLLIKLLESFTLILDGTSQTLRMVNMALYWVAVLLSVITFLDYLNDYRKRVYKN